VLLLPALLNLFLPSSTKREHPPRGFALTLKMLQRSVKAAFAIKTRHAQVISDRTQSKIDTFVASFLPYFTVR
jgi:hypothetical protein